MTALCRQGTKSDLAAAWRESRGGKNSPWLKALRTVLQGFPLQQIQIQQTTHFNYCVLRLLPEPQITYAFVPSLSIHSNHRAKTGNDQARRRNGL